MAGNRSFGGIPVRWRIPGFIVVGLLTLAVMVAIMPEQGEVLGALGLLVGQGSAAVLVIRRSRRLEHRERLAWRFYGAATALAATGVLAVGILSGITGELVPFGPTDAFFLASYLMMIVAIVRMARIDSDGSNWTITLLDASVGGVALTALVWNAFLHDVAVGLDAPIGATIVAISYPLMDIAMVVGLIILVIRRSHYHLDPRLAFLAAGMSVQVVSDFMFFSRGAAANSFADAAPAFEMLLVATTLFVVAAALVDRVPERREFPEDSPPIWAMIWPYLLAGSLLATHVTRYRSSGISGDDVLLLDALILIGALIFVRQIMEIHRNRRRVEAQRSELVASVSHELRTPLTAIVGYLSLLDESGHEFPEDARVAMISEATGEARHMSRLVNDLVMLARGANGFLALKKENVEVGEVVTSTLRNVDGGGKTIVDESQVDEVVNIDPDRVQQALTNLLSNAVRYGGDRVLLVAKLVEDDLVFEVHDDGEGVPTRYQLSVWQRFERGAHRLDATTPGLGIGLAIVKAVALSHGGRASYRQSERLGGACFTLEIPDAAAPSRAGDPVAVLS